MAVYINNIPCSIVVVFVVLSLIICRICIAEIPVHREINYIKPRFLCIIRLMIFVSDECVVIRSRLIVYALFIFVCFVNGNRIICTVSCTLFPCVERCRKRCNTVIPDFVYACTNFTEHIEVFSACFFKCRNKVPVKHQTAYMFYSINAESVYAHFDVFCVSVDKIFLNSSTFCVQVDTVFVNCS